MAAPMDQLSHLIGNSLAWVQAQPELRQMGHGVGLAFDLAVNAPMNTAYNVPMLAAEEGKQNGSSSDNG
jgi:hypothetical protein